MSWLTRTELGGAQAPTGPPVSGLILGAIPGEASVTLAPDEQEVARARSAATLAAAGIQAGDRAVVSLNSDGDLAGAQLASALGAIGAAGAVVGPRGRMRLLAAIRALTPNVWITTPTGALDFLARLYLEFNVDPMELDLEKILLVGEIASPGTERRLADEFESRVTGLYCDPLFGVALAHGTQGGWQAAEGKELGLARLDRDESIDRGLSDADADTDTDGGVAELVLRPSWSAALSDRTIRTGQVVGENTTDGLYCHTVGDHVLIRGRWLSIPLLRRALASIDGVSGWTLTVSRGDGTLDKMRVSLAFERASLVDNSMWIGRAREALAGVTPIAFELDTALADEETPPETIADERGHHLGVDRASGIDSTGAEPAS